MTTETFIRWTCDSDEDSMFTKYLYQPVWNLFNVSNIAGWLIAWGIVFLIFWLLYYRLPANGLNSSNGFLDSTRCVLVALAGYFLIAVVFIAITRPSFCKAKALMADEWRVNAVTPPPWLQPTVRKLEVKSRIRKGTD